MDDLAGKLSELLNSPEGMAQIQNLAQMLGNNQQNTDSPASSSSPPASGTGGASLGALTSLLGNLGSQNTSGSNHNSAGNNTLPDPGTLQLVTRLAPMLSAARQENDSTRLLQALRPLLGTDRQKKLDEAIRLLQVMRMLPMLRESGLLSALF